MKRLAIGVIGTGHLGFFHAKMLGQIPRAEFIGVFDTDNDRANRTARECKTVVYPGIEEILKDAKAVIIATPTSTHYEIAKLAIDNGIHVFIEKPISRTIGEAENLVRYAVDKQVLIQVGHIERFNPALLALESYRINPMFVESHRLAQFNPRGTDVAVVLDLMIHDIDVILSLVRSQVEKIEANGVAVVSDTVDIANARIQFENGCVANVTASRISQKKMRKMRLFQRDAYISIDFSDGAAEIFRLADPDESISKATMMLGKITEGKRNLNIIHERPKIKKVNSLQYELELFIGAVLDGSPPVVSGEDGLQALRVASEIMEKIRQQPISGQ